MWVFVLHFPSSSYCIWKQFSLCGLFVCFLLNFDPNQNINSHGRFSIIVIQFRPRAYEFQKNLLRFGIQADKNSAKSHYTQHSYWISVNLTNYWEYPAILSTKSLSISELTRLVIADVRLVTILWKKLRLEFRYVFRLRYPSPSPNVRDVTQISL